MRVMAEMIGMIVALGRKMTDHDLRTSSLGKGGRPSSSECGIIKCSFNPLSSSLEVFQTGEDCIAYDGEKMLRLIQSGAATCKKGVLLCFLKITVACLGCMAAAVQPKRLGNSQKTLYKRSSTSCRPRL